MKVLVLGSGGLLGEAFSRVLHERIDLVCKKRNEVDVSNKENVRYVVESERPDLILNCAAVVGGLYSQIKHPALYLTKNIMITDGLYNGVMESRHECAIMNFMSTCVYPENAVYPLRAENIEKGIPHESNRSYSLAKRLQLTYADAYWKEHRLGSCNITLGNLYGLKDRFDDPDNAHVIPALFRKFIDAKKNKEKMVKLLGNGKPLREFLYADDVAEIIYESIIAKFSQVKFSGKSPEHFLLSNHNEISIKKLAILIKDVCGAGNVEIQWQSNDDPGQLRKPSCSSEIFREYMTLMRPIDQTLKEIYLQLEQS